MNFKLDHKSSVPLHKQAEELLRDLISQEEYKNGKLIPNEVELSEHLKISRNTLRQAITKLTYEGLLVRKKRVGTHVVEKKVFIQAHNWMGFAREMELMNTKVGNYELNIFQTTPSEESLKFFDSKEKVFRLERLRGNLDEPFVYFVSEFNPTIKFKAKEKFARPLYEILENDFKIVVKTSKEEISVAAADSIIAFKLGIKTGDPILIRKRFVLDTNGVPVEFNIGYYKKDSFTYRIECQR